MSKEQFTLPEIERRIQNILLLYIGIPQIIEETTKLKDHLLSDYDFNMLCDVLEEEYRIEINLKQRDFLKNIKEIAQFIHKSIM